MWERDNSGFLDKSALLALLIGPEELATGDERNHWLLSLPLGELSGPIRYPDGLPAHGPWPLGDGTWLTADGSTLTRWTLG